MAATLSVINMWVSVETGKNYRVARRNIILYIIFSLAKNIIITYSRFLVLLLCWYISNTFLHFFPHSTIHIPHQSKIYLLQYTNSLKITPSLVKNVPFALKNFSAVSNNYLTIQA